MRALSAHFRAKTSAVGHVDTGNDLMLVKVGLLCVRPRIGAKRGRILF